MVIEIDHPQGKIKVVGNPVKLGETPATVRHAPPLLGQHNDEILASLGYRTEEIEKLRSAGAIR
jgi:crotonobetainyl-CoA:carnitine CoA-transferase CaiB-like acyl-CoA transferase